MDNNILLNQDPNGERGSAGTASSQQAFNRNPFREIPNFADAPEEFRARLDEIAAAFDKLDPEAGIHFGDSALAVRSQVAEQILAAQENERFGFVREPMEKMTGYMDSMNIEAMTQKVSTLFNKGAGVAKRNPMLTAATAGAALLLSAPAAIIGGGAAIALKERAKALRERGQPPSVETLEEQLRESITGFKPLVRELEMARTQLPDLRRQINELGKANIKALGELTLHISAGREIARRLETEDAPAALESGDADSHEVLTMNGRNLRHKLPILEQARNAAIIDVTTLANLVQAVTDIDMSLHSILTHEAANHRASLAAQGLTLDVLQTTKLVDEFRKRTEKGTETAITATAAAQQIAAAGRVDSPERLQATLDNLNRVKTLLETSMKALPAAERQRQLLTKQVEEAAVKVVDTQTAAATSRLRSGTNQPLLEGTTSGTAGTLPRPG